MKYSEKVPDDHYGSAGCRCLHCQVIERAREEATLQADNASLKDEMDGHLGRCRDES